MKKTIALLCLLSALSVLFISANEKGSTEDQKFIRALFDEALVNGESYENLRFLCKRIGHRLTGSPQAEEAVIWGKYVMDQLDFDTVYLQEIEAPHWERGEGSTVLIQNILDGSDLISVLPHYSILGGSVPTEGALTAEIIEINSYEELKERAAEVKGKVVFFNEPMDRRMINTFQAYGACAKYRYGGASEAAEFGAVAVVVRSLTTLTDHYPHTGSVGYKVNMRKIPAIALSTMSADELHKHLIENSNLKGSEPIKITMVLNCKTLPNIKTHNVIGEIRGSQQPDKYMIVGGHLDSWDLGEGAHDDGAGCVQSIEALRLLMSQAYKPKHSLRVILFMNEENGNMGGKSYASIAKERNEQHLFALETDRGGFSPRGFNIDANQQQTEFIASFRELLEPYGLHIFEPGFTGVDISPLKNEAYRVSNELVMMGLYPDPQRYFDYHHTEDDVFENVNQRELELGGASMAAMLYLMDNYWQEMNAI